MTQKATIKIDIMRSLWNIGGRYHYALAIDGKRYGPDAGPWKVLETVTIDVEELGLLKK